MRNFSQLLKGWGVYMHIWTLSIDQTSYLLSLKKDSKEISREFSGLFLELPPMFFPS